MFSVVRIYIWQGTTRMGKSCRGKALAQNSHTLQLQLRRQDILVKNIHVRFTIVRNKGVKAQEIFIFTRQIARLLSAGLPLIQILELLETSTNNRTLQNFIRQLLVNIENGYSLTEALNHSRSYFSQFYCHLIALGERTGSLGLMFNRIAHHQEKSLKLKSKLTGALLYPSVVLLVAVFVFLALLIGVIPQFERLFVEVGAPLPLLTQIVIRLSKALESTGMFISLFFLVFISVFIGLKKKYPVINVKLDQCYVRLPMVKKRLGEIIAARLSRVLATALVSGLPLVDALQAVAEIAGNFVYKTAILASCERISNGESFYQALSKQKILPTDFLQLIKIGEISGCLSETLDNAADLYEEKIDYFLSHLTELLEPLLIIILGLMVGILIIAMYLPIFSMGSIL